MSVIVFMIMLIGFVPSFFFRRSMMNRGPLPPIFVIHSILNVSFLSAVISQCWLVMKNKIANHKRNGIYWFLLSIAVLTINFLIIHKTAQKEGDPLALGTVVGNSLATLQFITFVSLGYIFRNRPDIHKRLLLFVTITMLGPAVARFPERYEWLRFSSQDMDLIVYSLGIQLALRLAVLVYDLFTRKRPHVVTVASILMQFANIFLLDFIITSGLGLLYVEFLKSL